MENFQFLLDVKDDDCCGDCLAEYGGDYDVPVQQLVVIVISALTEIRPDNCTATASLTSNCVKIVWVTVSMVITCYHQASPSTTEHCYTTVTTLLSVSSILFILTTQNSTSHQQNISPSCEVVLHSTNYTRDVLILMTDFTDNGSRFCEQEEMR